MEQTNRLKAVMRRAEQEAEHFGDALLGNHHVLLAMLCEGNAPVLSVLDRCCIDTKRLADTIREFIRDGLVRD